MTSTRPDAHPSETPVSADFVALREIMTVGVVTLAPEASAADVVRNMDEFRLSCIIVVDGGRPLGIITERDIVRTLAANTAAIKAKSIGAVDIMSTPLISLSPDDGLFDALVVARSQKVRHIPLLGADGALVGLVTESDLVSAHLKIYGHYRELLNELVSVQTRELRAANARLREMSMEEPLLRIGNRRAMEIDMHHTHQLAMRSNRPYSVVMFDVDFFKQYNDQYGHSCGDRILQTVTRCLQRQMRASDRLYRYGGDEIVALLPDTPPEGALMLAERMTAVLGEEAIEHRPSPHGRVTVSGGIGTGQAGIANVKTWTDVVAQADRGLSRAKRSGRNRICLVA
ncbi:MAG TPA: GGDEF domain-containing protein [Woeseiaceae bacterium]|nr:GGDEF domain-containing protein [Woeseiaceae bacterium]